jgi:hypothetical protein
MRSDRRDFFRQTAAALAATTLPPLTSAQRAADDRGEILENGLFAGMGVDAIRDIPSAGELVARLWKECVEAS